MMNKVIRSKRQTFSQNVNVQNIDKTLTKHGLFDKLCPDRTKEEKHNLPKPNSFTERTKK